MCIDYMAVFGSMCVCECVYMTVVSRASISMECLVIKTQSICRLYHYIHILHLLFAFLGFHFLIRPHSIWGPNFSPIKHINVKCNQFDGLIFHIGISSLCAKSSHHILHFMICTINISFFRFSAFAWFLRFRFVILFARFAAFSLIYYVHIHTPSTHIAEKKRLSNCKQTLSFVSVAACTHGGCIVRSVVCFL